MKVAEMATRAGGSVSVGGFAISATLLLLSTTPMHLSWRGWYTLVAVGLVLASAVMAILRLDGFVLSIRSKLRIPVVVASIASIVIMFRNGEFLRAIPEIVSGMPVLTVKGAVVGTLTWAEYWRWSNAHLSFISGSLVLLYAGIIFAWREQ